MRVGDETYRTEIMGVFIRELLGKLEISQPCASALVNKDIPGTDIAVHPAGLVKKSECCEYRESDLVERTKDDRVLSPKTTVKRCLNAARIDVRSPRETQRWRKTTR